MAAAEEEHFSIRDHHQVVAEAEEAKLVVVLLEHKVIVAAMVEATLAQAAEVWQVLALPQVVVIILLEVLGVKDYLHILLGVQQLQQDKM
jgi:hypothetical protein